MKIFTSMLVAVLLIGGAFYLANNKSQTVEAKNVSVVDGKQIIDLTVRGGYSPVKSVAKAGIPTVLRFNTNGVFDCSSSVRIPSMNLTKTLLPTGITEVDLGTPKEGILNGGCSMGMYPFEINFQK